MAQHTEKGEELTLKDKVTRFLSTYRNVIIALSVVILVALAAVAIYTLVMNNRIEESSIMAEELQESFEEWQSADNDEKAELEENIVSDAEDIISQYGSLYAAARAHMVLGKLHAENDEWEDAEDRFLTVSESFPKSYLAPVSLLSAAACREETEDLEGAVELYQRVEADYSENSPAAAQAVFSAGRVYERLDRTDKALGAYNSIVDNFSNSSWTNLARSRIIYLETK
ncbi:MAG: tetratricopeptide repeat protein [Spirochaetaceae bacterium]